MFLSDDMKDLLRIFNRRNVSYAICGGFAVAKHGFVRMTLDLDLLIDPSTENAEKVLAALVEFGFGSAGIELHHLTAPSTAITLGAQPNQIDLLTKMSSASTREVLGNAESTDLDGIPVRVVSKSDLLQAKREANRPKDRIDLEELSSE
ncbi:MAG: hypothetical protein JJU29_17790 [Verrucomicrobia bacterium]|nr:hypothetical protein [Verrucomicrobiota bacterium]